MPWELDEAPAAAADQPVQDFHVEHMAEWNE